jgi:hypothetical protein
MSKTEPKSWRDVIKVHPAADLFPMMPPDQLKALGEDIKANGFAHQIVLWTPDGDYSKWSAADCIGKFKRGEFYLLDGRNRVAAGGSLNGIGLDDNVWPNIVLPPALDAYDPIVLGPAVDPYEYVLSANMHRRHLTAEQKREIIAKLLKAQPEKSNRTIAQPINVDHKTVGSVRDRLEARGEIPHVSTVEDTKGRQQPTKKARRTADDFIADQKAQATAVADRAEEHSQQAEQVDEHVQNAAHAVELVEPKQSDIERVLPDADRLVHEIMARDANAPGYALAIARGIAAHLGDGYPEMPGLLKRPPEPTAPAARD